MPDGFSWEVIEVLSGSVLHSSCVCCILLALAAHCLLDTVQWPSKISRLHACLYSSMEDQYYLVPGLLHNPVYGVVASFLVVSQSVCADLVRQHSTLQAPKGSLQVEALGQDDWAFDMPTAQWPTHGSSANQRRYFHAGCRILQPE